MDHFEVWDFTNRKVTLGAKQYTGQYPGKRTKQLAKQFDTKCDENRPVCKMKA